MAGVKFLSNENVKILVDLALPIYLRQAIEKLISLDNSIVDMDDIFHELTTQLMGKMAYNVSTYIQLLEGPLFKEETNVLFKMEMHHSNEFSMAFDYASAATAARFQNPFWQITEFITGRRFRDAISKVKAFGSLIVSNYMQSSKRNEIQSQVDDGFGSKTGTLMNLLIAGIRDEKIVAEAALNFLSAGKYDCKLDVRSQTHSC